MPYAAKNRHEFVERLCLEPGTRILDLGGMLSKEIMNSVSGITTPGQARGAVLMDPEQMPFKNSIFDTVISYHFFDMISPPLLSPIFKEILRVLNQEKTFSFMVTLWMPQKESQRSSLFFNELLESTGALFRHELENISRQLSISGFREITVESINRDIIVPEEFIRSHFVRVANILKREKHKKTQIRTLAKQYVAHVNMHGESIMPAVCYTAKKI